MTQFLDRIGIPKPVTRFLRHNLAGLTLLCCALTLFLGAYVVGQKSSDQRATCQQVETLKTVIYKQVQASANLLGKKGTAGYAYYHEHPDELANAKQQLTQELSAFGPSPCH